MLVSIARAVLQHHKVSLNVYRIVDHGTKSGKIYTVDRGKMCTVSMTYNTNPQKQT